MPYTKEIGKSPVYHSEQIIRSIPMNKCMKVIYDFRKDNISHHRDRREVGCVLMYEDIYDAHVEKLCREKVCLFEKFQMKTPLRWN